MISKCILLFIENLDQHYYIKNFLQEHLLQYAQNWYGEDYFYFLQDSAPSCLATCIQEWLTKNVPNFSVPQDYWPASSQHTKKSKTYVLKFVKIKIKGNKI
jgi:hypothetical protein